ncbi:MAG: O-antigen ligase family protein [Candidatus Zixiibacteriota bacterium]
MGQKFRLQASGEIADAHPPNRHVKVLSLILIVFFGLFLFFSSFSIALAQTALGIAVLVFGAILITERGALAGANLRPLFAAWGLYLFWLVLVSLVNENPLRSLNNIREEWLLVIVPIGVYLNRNQVYRRRLLLLLALALLMISAYGIVQHFTGFHFRAAQPIHRAGDNWRLSGNFSHPLTYGFFVVTLSTFFLTLIAAWFRRMNAGQRRNWYGRILIAATLAGLAASALCNSRGPMLALGVGLIAVGWLMGQLRWTLIGLAAVCLMALILSPGLAGVFTQRITNDWRVDNPAGRLFIWEHSLAIAEENPIFGSGPGNFGESYLESLAPELRDSKGMGHAHNDFLHVAAIAGIPAVIFYLAIWIVALRRFWQVGRLPDGLPFGRALSLAGLAASVVFLAGSMTEAAFADEELRQILLVLWSFAWNPQESTA